MKLWQKICVYSLLLFISVLVSCGILMIENNKKTAFDWKLKQVVSEQTSISSGLMRYVMMERIRKGTGSGSHDKNYIEEFLDSRINTGGIYLEIRKEERILYSNFELNISEIMENIETKNFTEYRILKTKKKEYLMLTGNIPLDSKGLSSFYMVDISDIYRDRREQYLFFGKLTVIVLLLFTAGMYLIAGYLTKSLRILTKAVQKIEEGNYTERIEIQTKDEVGKLIKSHNCMAEAIEEKVRELENKNQEQKRFIDNFTHELRTPLTAVIGYADILRSMQCEEAEAQELGTRIFKEGKRIEKLSELMMDLTFLSRNSFTLKSYDMRDIIMEAEELFKTAAIKGGLQLIIEFPNYPIMILGEKELIIHLLGNIIDNAKKASEEGNCIWLRGRMEEENAVLEVEDQGKGIPKEDKEKIFERFYMVDKVRNGKNKGVGLGLSICTDIAKINNAKISLTSEEGIGTLVKILFPCYKQDTMSV